MHFILASILLVVSFASAHGVICHKGFNASVVGIPFYHWEAGECKDKSVCFSQELEAKIYKEKLKVTVQYGGCISTAYSSLITCESLFGPESTFDPAIVLSMVTNLDDRYREMTGDFYRNYSQQMSLLFSKGEGTEEGVEGVYALLQNLGFNTEKAEPLKPHLARAISALFYSGVSEEDWRYKIERKWRELENLLRALKTLNTSDPDKAESLYRFLNGIYTPRYVDQLKASAQSALIERLPGLVKSMIPPSWGVYPWYDVIFELLGDIEYSSPKSSTANVIETLKSVITIPREYNKYMDSVFKNLPDLVERMVAGNYSYASTWSVTLLEDVSVVNPVTTRLSGSVWKFLSGLIDEDLPSDIHTLITWFPGLLYKFFPTSKTDIDKIYNTLSEGMESIDWQNPSSTLPETKLSEAVIFITDQTESWRPGFQRVKKMKDLMIINFSKTLYNLLPDYAEQMNAMADTLQEEFKNFPEYDVGRITKKILADLGLGVPPEIKPFLDNVQELVDAFTNSNFSFGLLLSRSTGVISAYKAAYPKSELPGLAERWIAHYNNLSKWPDHTVCRRRYDDDWVAINTCYNEYWRNMTSFRNKIEAELNNLAIDSSFAIFQTLDVNTGPIYEAVADAFPAIRPLVHLFRTLEPAEMKEFYLDMQQWKQKLGTPEASDTLDSFASAINATVWKLTSKLGDVIKELRSLSAPDSCKYLSCNEDRCNSHTAIEFVTPVTRAPWLRRFGGILNPEKYLTEAPPTTTSGFQKLEATILLHLPILWLLFRVISE